RKSRSSIAGLSPLSVSRNNLSLLGRALSSITRSRFGELGVWSQVARPSSDANLSPRSSVTSSHNRICRWKSGEDDVQTSRVIGTPGCGSFKDQRERAGFFGSLAAPAFKLIGRDNDERSKM